MKKLMILAVVTAALAGAAVQKASAGIVVGASFGVPVVSGYCSPGYSSGYYSYPRPYSYGYSGYSGYSYNYCPPPAVVYAPPPVVYRPPIYVAPPVINFGFGFGGYHHRYHYPY